MVTGKFIPSNLKCLPFLILDFHECQTGSGLEWGKCQICICTILRMSDSLNLGLTLAPALEFGWVDIVVPAQTPSAPILAAETISWWWFGATSLTGDHSSTRQWPCPKLHHFQGAAYSQGLTKMGMQMLSLLFSFGRALKRHPSSRVLKS